MRGTNRIGRDHQPGVQHHGLTANLTLADGNGSNEATALSDDPSQPGPADATVIGIAEVVPVPMLDRPGLLLTGLLLALSGGLLLRRRG